MKAWTPKDDAYLRANYEAGKESELAKVMGCGVNKILQKARKLGLRQKMTMADIQHESMKIKKNKMTVELERYHQWTRDKGCLICKRYAAPHHQPFGSAKDHRYVAPLCHDHHQGDKGIHDLGNPDLFLEMYGVDLTQEALDNWEDWKRHKGRGNTI